MSFIRTLNYLQYPRVGLTLRQAQGPVYRKYGDDNGEQPMEGVGKVALLYTVICPERLPAEGVFSGSW